MPEKTEATSEEVVTEPKVRRISIKNPRKTAKTPNPEPEVSTEVPSEEFDSTPPTAMADDSPVGDETPLETSVDPKRKNRRRRGKGKSKDEQVLADTKAEPQQEQQDRQPQRAPNPPQIQKPRHKPDPEKLAKNAWKIFLAEVSEEGVALIGDNDARELARRCFRLSEIFLEEEDRRS